MASFIGGRMGGFILKEKLRLLKERLKWWNVNIFGKYDLAGDKAVCIMSEGDKMVDDDDGMDANSEDSNGKEKEGPLATFG